MEEQERLDEAPAEPSTEKNDSTNRRLDENHVAERKSPFQEIERNREASVEQVNGAGGKAVPIRGANSGSPAIKSPASNARAVNLKK